MFHIHFWHNSSDWTVVKVSKQILFSRASIPVLLSLLLFCWQTTSSTAPTSSKWGPSLAAEHRDTFWPFWRQCDSNLQQHARVQKMTQCYKFSLFFLNGHHLSVLFLINYFFFLLSSTFLLKMKKKTNKDLVIFLICLFWPNNLFNAVMRKNNMKLFNKVDLTSVPFWTAAPIFSWEPQCCKWKTFMKLKLFIKTFYASEFVIFPASVSKMV